MKTFIVISDSHGRRAALRKLYPLFAENDYIIHLGDGASDMSECRHAFPGKVFVAEGNCDFSSGEEEFVLEEEGVRVFCCHGHRYGVKGELSRLAARAKELGCSVALYGHTHRADIREEGGVLCVNPGALGSYSEPSYCYLVLHKGRATPTVVPLA